MEEKGKRGNWIKSIAINLIIMIAVLGSANPVYETNDDYAISSRIVEGFPEVIFSNYYLCLLLSKIQAFTDGVNVFVVTQIVLSFISFVIVLKILLDNYEGILLAVAEIACIIILSLDAYCMVQFSKAAALACISSVLLLADTLLQNKKIYNYVIGVLLLYAGSAMRVDVLIVALLYTGIYVFIWLVRNRKNLREQIGIKQLLIVVILAAAVFGCYAFKNASNDAIRRTTELEDYFEYNYLRAEVIDTTRLNHYEEQKDEYREAGFSDNDIKIIKKWIFDYDVVASSENLEKIISISDKADSSISVKDLVIRFAKGTIRDLRELTPIGVRIILMIVLAFWIIIACKPSYKLFAVAIGGLTLLFHIYLYYIERPVNRTMFTPDICAIALMMYAVASEREHLRLRKAVAAFVIVAAIMLVLPLHKDIDEIYANTEKRIMQGELTEYLEKNRDSFYVIAATEKKSNPSYMTPLRAPDVESEKNFMGTGSWGTKSPYVLSKMAAYGIKNPIKNLIDNDKAYYMGNKNIKGLTEYYNKWYGAPGREIHLEQVDDVGGIKVWSVKTK